MNVPRVKRKSEGIRRRVFEAAKQQFAPQGLYGPRVARSMSGDPYDGHTLPEALKQAAILSDVKPEVVLVDRGYKGVATEGAKIYLAFDQRRRRLICCSETRVE
ncbi:TetR family transcriptional regulator [Caballeronia choica]|uniref:TetR family transcriptional regulator n=1 Tax=Caballeronia choica TaxID=326476 RepID=A0A158KS70_9BURK|nr:hypothetical protein [Caballeronia choica]SAL83440.1 TetR family transcriptional regulator [Caballeronia choica]